MPLTTDKTARKERPIARGVLSYFPNAIAEVANVSFVGNRQHNPGEEMYWAREKSTDHADCIARHLIERGTFDEDGMRHSAKAAWRALAMLQLEIEAEGTPKVDQVQYKVESPKATFRCEASIETVLRIDQAAHLRSLGCGKDVADQIAASTSYTFQKTKGTFDKTPMAYIAGPMRGYEQGNFPAFDKERDYLLEAGYDVISPADIDHYISPAYPSSESDQTPFVFRDFFALYYLKKIIGDRGSIHMLPGWSHSTGATAEYRLAKWLGLGIQGAAE